MTLHTYHAQISNLHVSAKVDEYLDADLTVRVVLSSSEAPCTAEVLLKDPSGNGVNSQSKITMNDGAAQVTFQFKKGDISLWYPVGYGEQPLYDVHVKVFDGVRPNSIKGRNSPHDVMVARPHTGYQNSKDWVSPRACRGGKAG